MNDDFYDKVRKDCETWESTPEGKAYLKDQLDTEILNIKTKNKETLEEGEGFGLEPIPTEPKLIRQRKFNDFLERIIEIDIELLDDYYLLFKSTRLNSDIVIQTLKKEELNFICKEDGLNMNFVLFFDTVIDSKDKSRILGLFSKTMKVYLELLNESIISSDFDRECTGIANPRCKEDLDPFWINYFYFYEYFNSDEYKQEDTHNFLSLPTNHIEIIKEDDMRNTYRLTKSDKRLQLSVWN